MKVLFVNMAFEGHHKDYLKTLTEIDDIEPYIFMEHSDEDINGKAIIPQNVKFGSHNLTDHLKWCHELKKTYYKVKPDVIHFVWGDTFYRFMGIGFWWLFRKKSCITFHQVRKGCLHNISLYLYSLIFNKVIVHTDGLYEKLSKRGLKNAVHIEYPNFRTNSHAHISKESACEKLGIKTKNKIILCVGGTRIDKGLDILLTALQKVRVPFYLLIAGAEQNIKRDEINGLISTYSDNVRIILRYLTEEELDLCYRASDLIVLPYRYTFDGASGPLAEGVGYGKMIVGAAHGSLGRIIRDNHLGLCFETENTDSLKNEIERALSAEFIYDGVALQYQESLKVSAFQESYKTLYFGIV